MQNLALASERSSENHEPIVNQSIHKPRVLIPAVLLAQIARPIPWATAPEANREEHVGDLTRNALARGKRVLPLS